MIEEITVFIKLVVVALVPYALASEGIMIGGRQGYLMSQLRG